MTNNSKSQKSYDLFTFTDIVALQYTDDKDIIKSGVMTVDIEFYPSALSLNYLNIRYSDFQLEQKVESNPNILRNIDSYIRNKLLKLEYNI